RQSERRQGVRVAPERRLPEELEGVGQRLILDTLLRRELQRPLLLDLLVTQGRAPDQIGQHLPAPARMLRQDAQSESEVVLVDQPVDRRPETLDLERHL